MLNTGEPVAARPAATVMLLRGGSTQIEVLLVRRNPAARVMGGVWVFPGGAVDPGDAPDGADGDGEEAARAAGARELLEEAGIALTPSQLVPFARWITPSQVVVRFDTWFFLGPAPDGPEPRVDGNEIIAHRWYSPTAALQAAERDEIVLVFPTIRQLKRLARFPTASAAIDAVRDEPVQAVQPRIVEVDGAPRILLPGELGYD